MVEEQLYDIMCIDEDGYSIAHQRQMPYESANKEKSRLENLYPRITYYLCISVVEDDEDERVYNERAVDGWEDMFPEY